MQLTPELLSLSAPSLGRTPDICVTTALTVKKLAFGFSMHIFVVGHRPSYTHLHHSWEQG